MAIVTDGPLTPGLALTLRCFLLAAGARVELITQARVVHSVFSNTDGGFAVGLEFVNPSDQAKSIISTALPAPK